MIGSESGSRVRCGLAAAALVVALVLMGLGCDRLRPGFCEQQEHCLAGERCDLDGQVAFRRCVPVADGGAGERDATYPPQPMPAARDGGEARAPVEDGGSAPPPPPPPDGNVPCTGDPQCPAERPICSGGRCVECALHLQCTSPSRRFCSGNVCVGCQEAGPGACSAPTGMCDPGSGACVECLANATCTDPRAAFCTGNRCVGCGMAAPQTCAQLMPERPACGADGACTECNASADCTTDPAKPICTDHRCGPCTDDTQCVLKLGPNPGVCLRALGGRCATDAETIYVKRDPGCGNAGTAAAPVCGVEAAVPLVSANRAVVVARGLLEGFTWNRMGNDPAVFIIGQGDATITSPVGTGIQVASGNVRIRSLRAAGNRVGIVVEAGATVELYGVVAELNREGGLQIADGATFDIQNSVFAKNGRGLVGPTAFGGVYLGTPGANRTGRFRANTVVDNSNAGVVCASSSQSLLGVLLFNNTVANALNCQPPTGREGADPRFSLARAYHLTEGSPCQDAMASDEMPPDDIDGEPRPHPAGGRSDCGADEYHP